MYVCEAVQVFKRREASRFDRIYSQAPRREKDSGAAQGGEYHCVGYFKGKVLILLPFLHFSEFL